jgi:iron complex transport system substrate-binding protein
VDDAGDTVALARPAARVVSLVPAATELLYAIGAGPALVGRTDWCDHPPEAAGVPSVGAGLEPNIEAVVAARPDLVILYPSPQTTVAAARLRSLGIPAMQWRTDGIADLRRGAAHLGLVTGHVEDARTVVARLDSALAAATRTRALRPSVLILAWDQPPIAIGRASFLSELVERAGGDNVFGDLVAASGPVGLETIVSRDPDLILAMDEMPDFAARPEWQVVRAVRERRFLVVRGSDLLRPTPRAGAAVHRLAAVLDSLGFR